MATKKQTADEKTEKEVKAPARRGRPSTYSQYVADEICERLSKGEPLEHICRDEHMPASRTVSDWKKANESFSADFARARDTGYDAIAAECLEIADETSNDTVYGENGERPNTEWIQRSKLRIETRLKLLAKWDPKRYGDKIDLNHGGQVENPLAVLLSQVQGTPIRPKTED